MAGDGNRVHSISAKSQAKLEKVASHRLGCSMTMDDRRRPSLISPHLISANKQSSTVADPHRARDSAGK